MTDKAKTTKHKCVCGQDVFEVYDNEGHKVILNFKRKRMYVKTALFQGHVTSDMGTVKAVFVDQWVLKTCHEPHYISCTMPQSMARL